MVLWNLLDGGPSHKGPFLGPSESLQGGTPGTNPCQCASHQLNDEHLSLSNTVAPQKLIASSTCHLL
jgi:hypothetical protein